MEDLLWIVLMLGFIAVLLWVTFFLPAQMAEERGRSAIGWVCISIFFSPVVAIVGLLVLGDTYEEAKRKDLGGRSGT